MIAVVEVPLPPRSARFSGMHYQKDEDFIASGIEHAKMLEALCGVSRTSHLLDIGCGQGRLLTGLLNHFGSIGRYTGIDVHEPSIRWLKENVEPLVPNSAFHWLDYPNARYNPVAERRHSGGIPFKVEGKFDCVTLFSVFSHMLLSDIELYFEQIAGVLKPSGRVFLTAFVESNVKPETENPEGYRMAWKGALHCVRLNREHFEQIARTHGRLAVERFSYADFLDGQSSYVFKTDHWGRLWRRLTRRSR
jgi:SAM-dependent methyltransferase